MNFSKLSKKSNINLTTALVANNASKDGKKVMLHGRLEVHIDQAKGIAAESNAKNLILTHFSQSIIDNSIESVKYKNKKCAIFNEKFFLTS